jgi:hypothetical protein
VYDAELEQVIHSSSQFAAGNYGQGQADVALRAIIPARALKVGDYHCTLVVGEQNVAIFEKLESVLNFTIADTTFPGPGQPDHWGGFCAPRLINWSWQS